MGFSELPRNFRDAGTLTEIKAAVAGDYDWNIVSVEDAADQSTTAGISAAIYSTANHWSNLPGWFVVAQLACPITYSDFTEYY